MHFLVTGRSPSGAGGDNKDTQWQGGRHLLCTRKQDLTEAATETMCYPGRVSKLQKIKQINGCRDWVPSAVSEDLCRGRAVTRVKVVPVKKSMYFFYRFFKTDLGKSFKFSG